MAKNKFSKQWIHDHINDPYVKLAQKHGYRARAAFKLIEIDAVEHLIQPGMIVVDLGATPGSWSQVLRERFVRPGGGLNGRIIALDLLPMEPIPDVEFIQGDFREDVVLEQLLATLAGAKVDLVVSDMAPNLSGVGSVDGARMAHVVELAMEFALAHLTPHGALVAKCFHGPGFSQSVQLLKTKFIRVVERKPKASRAKSAETFIVAKGLKLNP
jgi:23S rRNA (uridine2552-2'-O)-methyltransferase